MKNTESRVALGVLCLLRENFNPPRGRGADWLWAGLELAPLGQVF